MADNVASLKAAGPPVAQAMMDDQKTVMHVTPLDAAGNPTSLPSGSPPPVYTVDNSAILTLNPGIDPTGLSCGIVGVKGQAGTAIVIATFTNPDASTATGSAIFTQSIDPAELDVNTLGVTVDTPVAQ